jgi:hypothetical protein
MATYKRIVYSERTPATKKTIWPMFLVAALGVAGCVWIACLLSQ